MKGTNKNQIGLVLVLVLMQFVTQAQILNSSVNPAGSKKSKKDSVAWPPLNEKVTIADNNAEIFIDPCIPFANSSSDPYRSGMFQFDGDFESFAASSHSDASSDVCVTTDYTITHQIATLQDNTCHNSRWKVSHGTPEVCYDGMNHFIHLWSGDWSGNGDFEGEGIFYDCSLYLCGYYDISLWLSSTGNIKKIYFYLATGLTHLEKNGNEWDAESIFYNLPWVSSPQLVHEMNDFNSGAGNWVKISIPVFKPNTDGMKLWIFTEDDNNIQSQGNDLLFIDEVSDGLWGSSATCTGTVNYTSAEVTEITRANIITASGTAHISSGRYADFGAGSSVRLLPGFQSFAGSDFYAHIVPCVSSAYCPTDPPVVSEAVERLNEAYEISIFPNPSSTLLYIDNERGEVLSVKLVSETTHAEVGVRQYSAYDDKIEIDVGLLPEGFYIVVLKTVNGSYSKRVLIKR